MEKDSFFEKNKIFFAIIFGAVIIGLFILTSLLIINNKPDNNNLNTLPDKKTTNQIEDNEIELLSNPPINNKDTSYETVSKIVDGDTITLSNNEKIRFIGINTEERGQKCYQEATD